MKTIPQKPNKVKSKQKREQIQAEALLRATSGQTWSNYAEIFRGFMAKGIAEDQILPRENVFTYQAWRALGRYVCKGEHGVKICTWIPVSTKTTDRDGNQNEKEYTMPRTVTVFHISQTEPMSASAVAS